jgi:hypothetical protein
MKSFARLSLFVIASVVVACLQTYGGLPSGQFEGELALRVTTRQYGLPNEMLVNLFIKGEDVAFHVQSARQPQKGMIIYHAEDHLLWIINDEEKTYLELEADSESAALVGNRMDLAGHQGPATVRKTGKTKTILGYKCEEVMVEEDSSIIDLWGNAELASIYGGFMKAFARMQGPGGGAAQGGWQEEMLKLGLFPLQSTRSRHGEVIESQDVTKIDPRALDSAMFRPPSGYARQAIEFDTGGMKKLLEQIQQKMQEMERQKDQGPDSTLDQDSSRHHQ